MNYTNSMQAKKLWTILWRSFRYLVCIAQKTVLFFCCTSYDSTISKIELDQLLNGLWSNLFDETEIFLLANKTPSKYLSESYYGYMITVTRLGEFGHRRRRRWRVRRSIQIYSDSHWGRINSKVEIICSGLWCVLKVS